MSGFGEAVFWKEGELNLRAMSTGGKILVCEDNKLTQRLFEASLRKADYDIIIAVDGEQAIRYINEEEIRMVITDINMPFNNGLEVVEYVRKRYRNRIPVIIVTNINLEETRAHARELGADAYLTKPFDPDELIGIIQTLESNQSLKD